MSRPQQQTQTWYYNTPYPPILSPVHQFPHNSSPSDIQPILDIASPSPRQKYPYIETQRPLENGNFVNNHDNPNMRVHQTGSSRPQNIYTSLQDFPIPEVCEPRHELSKPSGSKPSPMSLERMQIAHPYSRIYANKQKPKCRRTWNHVLEKSVFTPYEILTLGAPRRRSIYTSSLEAHIECLHNDLLALDFWPVKYEDLDPFKGLNDKTAKSMIATLQFDASTLRLKLHELEFANKDLQNFHSKKQSVGLQM